MPIEPGIRENSFLARCAARILKSDRMAMVMGKTILLHNTTKAEFLADQRWVRHEMEHIRQFKQYGLLLFLVKYLWECMKVGYQNNKYEVEARKAEERPL